MEQPKGGRPNVAAKTRVDSFAVASSTRTRQPVSNRRPNAVEALKTLHGWAQNPASFSKTPDGFPQTADVFSQSASGCSQSADVFSQTASGCPQFADVFSQTVDGFPQSAGGFSQTLDVFSQSAGVFLETAGGFSKNAGPFFKTPGVFLKPLAVFRKSSGLFPKPLVVLDALEGDSGGTQVTCNGLTPSPWPPPARNPKRCTPPEKASSSTALPQPFRPRRQPSSRSTSNAFRPPSLDPSPSCLLPPIDRSPQARASWVRHSGTTSLSPP